MSRCARRLRVIQALVAVAVEITLRSAGRCQAPVCPTVRVAPGSALPFSADDVQRLAALRMRGAGTCACPIVDVAPADGQAGVVAVSCPDRRAEVAIHERTGEDAARMVAIVLTDLATAPAALPPAPPPAPPSVPALAAAPAPGPADRPRWSFRVAAGPTWDSSDGTGLEPMAGAGWSPLPRLRVGIDLGYGRRSASTPKTAIPATVDSLPMRAGLGLSVGPARVEAGAAVRGYRAHAADSQLGVRKGAFLAVAWSFRGWSSLRPYLSAGADIYIRKLQVVVDGAPTLTEGALMTWLAVGFVWSRVTP